MEDILLSDDLPSGFMLRVYNAPVLPLLESVLAVAKVSRSIPGLSSDEEVKSIVDQALKIGAQKNTDKLMTDEEAAAIYLYTCEEPPIYRTINEALRENNMVTIESCQSYIRLLLTALHKLPLEKIYVYRGVREDLPSKLKPNHNYIWWGFSSSSIEIDKARKFCKKVEGRSLLKVRAYAVDVSKYSRFPEEERLMLPCTRVHVKSWTDKLDGIFECELEVVKYGAPLTDYPHPMFFCDVRL